MVCDINWDLVVPIRKKAERLFDALSSISRWNGPLRPSYRLRSLVHKWHAWNAVSRGLLWINTIVICVWWMMLWLKDGIVKQHQSLYFLLLFCGCHWRYNFTQFQPAVKVVTTNIFVWMYFLFSVNWETTMFAISKKAYSHFSCWQLIIEFVAAIDAVYLSSRDRIYGPVLGSNVKSSEWTLIDYDIFSINIIIFARIRRHLVLWSCWLG